jgi:hypothetical protein
MTQKLNRRYRLLIDVGTAEQPEVIEITDPLTIEFNITRGIHSSLNSGSFKVYNLSNSTRTRIFQDRFRLRGSSLLYKRITMQAGYNQLATIFRGNLLQSFPFRKGGDIIQQIDALDGSFGLLNSFTSLTLNKGTTANDAIDKISNDLVNIEKGIISQFNLVFKKSLSLFGDTIGEIKKIIRGEADVFIDDEKLLILKTNECVEGQVQLINSETGLLGTPIRRNTFLQVEIVFEPRITVGQIVKIKSSVNPAYDGTYKVVGITHTGTISGAVAGTAKTILQLFIGTEFANGLQTIGGIL